MSATTRQPHFALLLGLAWLLVVLQLVAQNWADTAQTLLDTDDAMRLVQMRDWLAGQGWYDTNFTRVQPPAGYESHWSRLIDAGLAGTLWVFGLFFDGALAERLMRTAWPMLWLLPAMAGTAAIAWRIAGREAALLALLLALVGLPAFHQFRPGRIDHHNVQIALSVLVVAATVWSDRVRWAAYAAGALTGLALAIGLECLPYLLVCAAAFALRYVVDARRRAGCRRLRPRARRIVGRRIPDDRRARALGPRRVRRHRGELAGAGADRRARSLARRHAVQQPRAGAARLGRRDRGCRRRRCSCGSSRAASRVPTP